MLSLEYWTFPINTNLTLEYWFIKPCISLFNKYFHENSMLLD